jgi:uncharacterized membrane protein
MGIIKAIYVHLITKPKYNRLKIEKEEEIRVREERTRERDEQIKINKILKQKFDEELDKLIKEKIELKEENIKLKKRKVKKNV